MPENAILGKSINGHTRARISRAIVHVQFFHFE